MSRRVGLRAIPSIGGKKAVPVLIDSTDSITSSDRILVVHPSSSSDKSAYGQSFKLTRTRKLTSVKFQIGRFGVTDGEAVAVLSSHAGTYGVSSVPNVDIEESDVLDTGTLLTGYRPIEFTFSGRTILHADTPYCIFIKITSDIKGGVDIGLHYLDVHGGNAFYYANNAWTSRPIHEMCFLLYGV